MRSRAFHLRLCAFSRSVPPQYEALLHFVLTSANPVLCEQSEENKPSPHP
jgi:hypothetical protein